MPSITDSIGRVLGGRYRLLTPLGTGASAHVFLADDVTLHRQVAIKVLHPALAGDAAFLKRFRAEARAVGALNHPNILRVYDWGEERGEPYLVLEFLAGGSLRQILDTGVCLTPAQATQVGLEAATGLDYAHRRGLIHRDIKPANLLFDADRRLRIADFGLARALAEAAWTEPDGAILGTARYAAPEQVEGLVLDGKADVYALALVLFEAVTGSAPFVGDTTVATLMARVGALLPEHDALGPLNEVLVWAAAPDPSERYDAAQLVRRLQALALALPEPEPLPIVESIPAEDAPPLSAPLGSGRRPPTVWDPNRPEDETELGIPAPPLDDRAAAQPLADVVSSPPRPWPWKILLAMMAVLLVVVGVVAAIEGKVFTPSHPVPSVVGVPVAQATRDLARVHLVAHVTGRPFSTTVRAGDVVDQTPSASTSQHPVSRKEGATVDLLVSNGPPPVDVPTLSGFSNCKDAIAALAAVHLVGVCPASAAQYSSSAPAGAVVGSAPTGTAPYGSTITIITSKGHAPVVVPSVAGGTYAAAAKTLSAAGFLPAQHQVYNATIPAGQVISTTPGPAQGPVPFGSPVTVVVSLGPQPVTVPDLVGGSVAAAASSLQGLGLVLGGPYGPSGATTVISTSPAAGASVPPGTTVLVYAS